VINGGTNYRIVFKKDLIISVRSQQCLTIGCLGAEFVPAKRAELIFTFARYRFYSWLYSSGIKEDKFIEGKFLSFSFPFSSMIKI